MKMEKDENRKREMSPVISDIKLFDSHLHIIDPRFPLTENQGYLPPAFTCYDYLKQLQHYQLIGGAIVSGSFQAFDQSYLKNALNALGPSFVGVTQVPATISDQELLDLHNSGVRAVRFNLKRGGSEEIDQLSYMAHRIHELVGWHVELYVDSKELAELYKTLISLPSISIDHLGLSKEGFSDLINLVEAGAKVKLTGFSRINFDIKEAIKTLYQTNPEALMFGTDLPSTRAPTPYSDNDWLQAYSTLATLNDHQGESAINRVFSQNALQLYKLGS